MLTVSPTAAPVLAHSPAPISAPAALAAPAVANDDEQIYQIPAAYRRMENLHILFWLLKDIGWCMIWRPLGLAMVLPTLSIALLITWRTRHMAAELAHNLAISLWISANSYWMISEFWGFDEVKVWGNVTGKHLALLPFSAGLFIMLYYYLVQRPREKRQSQTAPAATVAAGPVNQAAY